MPCALDLGVESADSDSERAHSVFEFAPRRRMLFLGPWSGSNARFCRLRFAVRSNAKTDLKHWLTSANPCLCRVLAGRMCLPSALGPNAMSPA